MIPRLDPPRRMLAFAFRRMPRFARGRTLAFAPLLVTVLVAGIVACAKSDAVASEPEPPIQVDTTGQQGAQASCASPRPEWLWCDDFETDRMSSYFEYNSAGGRFVRAAGAGRDGSYGMRATYDPSQSEAGSLKLAFGRTPDAYIRPVDAGTAKYRELYWRWYIRHPEGWSGGGPDKMTRATILATNQWAQAMIAHVWDGSPGNDIVYLDPASGTDPVGVLLTAVYNDFDRLRWLGAVGSTTNIFAPGMLGKWVCFEAHVRLNDAGASNGVFELWIDGTREASVTNLNWVGTYSAYGLNAVFFENYWNARAPVEESRTWDDLVVSTGRIGC